jgi:hypothetical protein
MERGYVRSNKALYGAPPLLLVCKKDRKSKMCIDYWALNKITIITTIP